MLRHKVSFNICVLIFLMNSRLAISQVETQVDLRDVATPVDKATRNAKVIRNNVGRPIQWSFSEGAKSLVSLFHDSRLNDSHQEKEKRSFFELRKETLDTIIKWREASDAVSEKECQLLWMNFSELHAFGSDGRNAMYRAYHELLDVKLPSDRKLEVYRLVGQQAYLKGRFSEAEEFFRKSLKLYDSLDAKEKELSARTVGYIVGLYGSVLRDQSKTSLAMKVETRVLRDKAIKKFIPKETLLATLSKIATQKLKNGEGKEAKILFSKSLELLESLKDVDLTHRKIVFLSVGYCRSSVLALKKSNKEFVKELKALERKFENVTGIKNFDLILKEQLLIYHSLNDRESYRETLRRLCEFLSRSLENEQSRFDRDLIKDELFAAVPVLIKLYKLSGNTKKGVSYLKDLTKSLKLPQSVLQKIPDDIIEAAGIASK